MRRWLWSVLAGLLYLGIGGPALAGPRAAAEPSPSAVAAQSRAVPGTAVCTIQDDRLISLSGMAAIPSGYVMVNDFTGSGRSDRVFFLDTSCKVSRTVAYPGGPRDPEDLAVGRDGTIWVADTGDNGRQRSSVALWKVPASGTPVLHRLRYPDGRHDAEALLLDAEDQPVIVTKDAGVSGLYVPEGPLVPASTNSQGVAMRKVGEFKPQRTGTDTPLALIGQIQVTGGANAPDRSRVVLRTYSDAYEWDIPDGDVVKAVTTGRPRITPLPGEPWGESITYSTDGRSFLTVSETENLPADERPQLLRYTPVAEVKPTTAAGAVPPKHNTLSWYERLSLTEVTSLLAGVGAFGVLLVAAGVIGILRARRRPARPGGTDDGGTADPDGAGEPAAVLVAGGRGADAGHRDGAVYGRGGGGRGAVYGGGGRGETHDAGSYGRDPGGRDPGGSVYGRSYGGGPNGGGSYGGGPHAGGRPGDGWSGGHEPPGYPPHQRGR